MKISVIIPVFNGERYICQAIESVFRQAEHDPALVLEIIVVDNNSTDGTESVVRAAFGSRLQLIQEDVQGLPSARNAGLKVATAPFVAFLDADDIWLPEKLSRQAAVLKQDPGMHMVFSHCVEFSDPPEMYSFRSESRAAVIGSAMLTRREVFDTAGPFPDFRSGEFIAWYGWAQALGFRTFVVPEVLFHRRVHAHNMTRDRDKVADYPRAMQWLMAKRRTLVPKNA